MNSPIICIEDDEDDQHLIGRALMELEIPNKLFFFTNGETALAYLQKTEERPFLILCDINMPIMNGLELRHQLNESEYLRKKSVPFVFLTTGATPETVQLAYDETVQGFCLKPNSYSDLREQIRLIVAYWKSCLHPNKDF